MDQLKYLREIKKQKNSPAMRAMKQLAVGAAQFIEDQTELFLKDKEFPEMVPARALAQHLKTILLEIIYK